MQCMRCNLQFAEPHVALMYQSLCSLHSPSSIGRDECNDDNYEDNDDDGDDDGLMVIHCGLWSWFLIHLSQQNVAVADCDGDYDVDCDDCDCDALRILPLPSRAGQLRHYVAVCIRLWPVMEARWPSQVPTCGDPVMVATLFLADCPQIDQFRHYVADYSRLWPAVGGKHGSSLN